MGGDWIHVFPTPEKPYIFDRKPELASDFGSYHLPHVGIVHWRHVVDRPAPFCAYCNDGRCEQRVEWSASWSDEIVVHDRPRAVTS